MQTVLNALTIHAIRQSDRNLRIDSSQLLDVSTEGDSYFMVSKMRMAAADEARLQQTFRH